MSTAAIPPPPPPMCLTWRAEGQRYLVVSFSDPLRNLQTSEHYRFLPHSL